MTDWHALVSVLALSWTTVPGVIGAVLLLIAAPVARTQLVDWSRHQLRPILYVAISLVIAVPGVLIYGAALYDAELQHSGAFPIVGLALYALPGLIDLLFGRVGSREAAATS